MNLAQYNKAIGVLIIGGLAWWNDVIGGPSAITATEWHRLAAVVAGVVTVYLLRNDPATVQNPPVVQIRDVTPGPPAEAIA